MRKCQVSGRSLVKSEFRLFAVFSHCINASCHSIMMWFQIVAGARGGAPPRPRRQSEATSPDHGLSQSATGGQLPAAGTSARQFWLAGRYEPNLALALGQFAVQEHGSDRGRGGSLAPAPMEMPNGF